MNKNYNKQTTTDMPLDSFMPQIQEIKEKKQNAQKSKINAIGKSTENRSKSSTVKSSTSKTSTKSKTSAGTDKKTQTKSKTTEISAEKELKSLEKINEENIKSFGFKSKRNTIVIVLLSISLALVVATISIYFAITKLKTNCNMYAHGVEASFIVNGQNVDEFRSPTNLQGNCILLLKIEVNIKEEGEFKIKFIPECYQNGVMMKNTQIYKYNLDLFTDGMDGYYYSKKPIKGNQTILLCEGVILDKAYENTLNVSNFKMDFRVYFDKNV